MKRQTHSSNNPRGTVTLPFIWKLSGRQVLRNARPRVRPRLELLEDRLPLAGSISGQVFEDLNNNATHDAGEPGLDGWEIQLYDVNTAELVATTTSASIDLNNDQAIDPVTEMGLYAFDDLPQGKYVLQQVMQEGWRQNFPGGNSGGAHVQHDSTADVSVSSFSAERTGVPNPTRNPLLLPDLSVDLQEGLSDWYIEGNSIRFSMATPNLGRGRMELRGGPIQDDGRQLVYQRIFRKNGGRIDREAGFFTYHPEHGHIHFDGYAEYHLRELLPDGPDADTEPDVGAIVASGGKVSFCLLDSQRVTPRPAHSRRQLYIGCNDVRQGISPGWMDVYGSGLEGQEIDITNLAPGRYYLEAVVDPDNALMESNEANNFGRVPVLIPIEERPGNHDVDLGANENVSGRDFGNFQPAVIRGTVYEDHDGDGERDADVDQGLGNQTVYLDLNDNGQFDGGVETFAAADVPIEIPKRGTITSTVTLSNLGTVVDLNVKLTIRHTYDGDLKVTLISPHGTRVELFAGVGGGGDDFVNTVLDDEASSAAVLSGAKAPFTGTFLPQGSLATFDGETASGVWTLEVEDTASGDRGSLEQWSLTVTHEEPHEHTEADGSYAFTDLDLGTYRPGVLLAQGFTQTTPMPGALTATTSGAMFVGVDFGVQQTQAAIALAGNNRATALDLGLEWWRATRRDRCSC